jgi:hypothetical protein
MTTDPPRNPGGSSSAEAASQPSNLHSTTNRVLPSTIVPDAERL